jgi:cell division protein FtsB
MKWLAAGLALVIVLLQYRIWFSEGGVREVDRLRRAVAAQSSANDQLAERNRQLAAEVRDLKTGMEALEERARSDLGMIAAHETFYQVVPPSSPTSAPVTPSGQSSTRTAAAH